MIDETWSTLSRGNPFSTRKIAVLFKGSTKEGITFDWSKKPCSDVVPMELRNTIDIEEESANSNNKLETNNLHRVIQSELLIPYLEDTSIFERVTFSPSQRKSTAELQGRKDLSLEIAGYIPSLQLT